MKTAVRSRLHSGDKIETSLLRKRFLVLVHDTHPPPKKPATKQNKNDDSNNLFLLLVFFFFKLDEFSKTFYGQYLNPYVVSPLSFDAEEYPRGYHFTRHF